MSHVLDKIDTHRPKPIEQIQSVLLVSGRVDKMSAYVVTAIATDIWMALVAVQGTVTITEQHIDRAVDNIVAELNKYSDGRQ